MFGNLNPSALVFTEQYNNTIGRKSHAFKPVYSHAFNHHSKHSPEWLNKTVLHFKMLHIQELNHYV